MEIRKNIKDSEWNNFPNFRKSEFVCPKYCNGFPSEIAYSLVEFMQKLRSHYNRAIHINSGLRCRKFNNQLRGSSNESDHLQGLACDFNFENHVFTKEELFQKIWGMESVGDVATVTVHIKKIREKVESDTSKPQSIETIWGVGYRFKV